MANNLEGILITLRALLKKKLHVIEMNDQNQADRKYWPSIFRPYSSTVEQLAYNRQIGVQFPVGLPAHVAQW